MSQDLPRVHALGRRWLYWFCPIVAAALAAVVWFAPERFAALRQWFPGGRPRVTISPPDPLPGSSGAAPETHRVDGPTHDGHSHAGHDAENTLEMSAQARKNIGLRVSTVKLGQFIKTISVPGVVAARPGRSKVFVTAPLTGIITKIDVEEGEAVKPGHQLLDLRLTHEELVQSQAEFLQTAEELAVTTREIQRIERLAETGGLPGKQLLERQYERQKYEAILRSKREALILHGLSPAQVDSILTQRELLKGLSVVTPDTVPRTEHEKKSAALLQVQSVPVSPGQHVTAGDTLLVLADHAELYIQGEAFERDIPAISGAAESAAAITAVLESETGRPETVSDLRVVYLANEVDSTSRTLDFFVALPNQLQRDATASDGRRYIAWRFRPGQRVQLQVPLETLTDRVILPIEALAQEGVETYVFVPDQDHFDRRPVHVEYRDTQWAVIANDGSLRPGESVAISGAQQLQLALKNRSNSGLDPHAGHHH